MLWYFCQKLHLQLQFEPCCCYFSCTTSLMGGQHSWSQFTAARDISKSSSFYLKYIFFSGHSDSLFKSTFLNKHNKIKSPGLIIEPVKRVWKFLVPSCWEAQNSAAPTGDFFVVVIHNAMNCDVSMGFKPSNCRDYQVASETLSLLYKTWTCQFVRLQQCYCHLCGHRFSGLIHLGHFIPCPL